MSTDYMTDRKALFQATADAREARNKAHQDLYDRARAAGLAAGEAAVPAVMVVEQHKHPFDDNSPVTQRWVEPEGPCGFASIVVRPGNCSFAIWLKNSGKASKHWRSGMSVWVGDFGQSLARKSAYAAAFAGVLAEAGIKAYPESRMD